MRLGRGRVPLARKAILITLVAAAFVAIPSPAQAKILSLRSVAVQGPGLPGPLVVGRLEFQGTSGPDSPTTILWERILSDYGPTLGPPLSLGPKYLIEYRFTLTLPRPHPAVIRQDLYPYAEGGPLAFTLPHQIWKPTPRPPQSIPSRWHAYPQVLITTLQGYGLPAAPSPAPLLQEMSDPGSAKLVWILSLGILLLLAPIGPIYLWSQRRRRRDQPKALPSLR